MKAIYRRTLEVVAPVVARAGVRRIAAALTLSAAGAAGIISHEGSVDRVYLDPVGIPTACVGHTGGLTHADVGKPVPAAVCAEYLQQDSSVAQNAVRRCVTVPITQDQFDALVSLAFNIGGQAFCSSTLVRKLNAGECTAAAAQFDRWIRSRGQILPGLIKRRAAERALFEPGCPDLPDPSNGLA